MPEYESTDVLTLAEAAAYLRISEIALDKLASSQDIPGQKIDGEWRFLKRALNNWLAFGGSFGRHLPGAFFLEMFGSPAFDRLLKWLESQPEKSGGPKPGSKAAVLQYAGSVGEGENAEEWLEQLRALRDASG